MTGSQLSTLGIVVSIIVGIAGVVLMAIQSSNTADARRKAERDEEIKRALDPIREDLLAMTQDRDYWRSRANQYEDRAQSRGGSSTP